MAQASCSMMIWATGWGLFTCKFSRSDFIITLVFIIFLPTLNG